MKKNKIELTGTIHRLFKLKPKANGPMTKILLKVGRDIFWIISYGNMAAAIGRLNEGDELSIVGIAKMNNWKTEAGEWKNDFNAVAWTAEIDGQRISYEKADTGSQDKERKQSIWDKTPNNPQPPQQQNPSEYDTIPNTPF